MFAFADGGGREIRKLVSFCPRHKGWPLSESIFNVTTNQRSTVWKRKKSLKTSGQIICVIFLQVILLRTHDKEKELDSYCITDDTIVCPKSDIQAKYEHQK